jgi:phosphate starvation-inducible PhoH-like protein
MRKKQSKPVAAPVEKTFYQKVKTVSIYPKNKNQRIFLKQLQDDRKSIIFAIGHAGCGKTYLSVQYGIKQFQEGKIQKIVITRPAVSADEDLGSLPGDVAAKMEPWVKPILDVFAEYYSQKEILHFIEEGVIEICPFSYMRGRSIKNAFIIADEVQNCTMSQVKTLLTRIGENSKMVITGDLTQADRGNDNGLWDFIQRFKQYDNPNSLIDMIEFTLGDVERHPVVKEILEIYGHS